MIESAVCAPALNLGDYEESNFPPVMIVQNDTTYEELIAVGFRPATKSLEAVVLVKRPNGCSGPGDSFEYVRFYLDYGKAFQDLGYVATDVQEIQNEKDCSEDEMFPLTFVASLAVSPQSEWSMVTGHVKVRAILSWQSIPPPKTPHFVPVWGNHVDADLQIARVD